ncbi:MAG: metalloregulator ArsR/SmtB family transcription factor [Desulfobacterales bacterium]|nr:metalloregulator ArsR/SmtB family transcription factor [Desulfobacterales bacterium]
MQPFTRVMKALSDPSRVKIIKLLQHRTMCVCELQSLLGLAQPTVSKHLRILEETGLVESSKDGLWVNYTLASGAASPYAASLLGNMRHWLEDDPDIRAAVGRLPFVDRQELCGRVGDEKDKSRVGNINR